MDSVSAIKLIRTDTTLDLSQKAEKGMLKKSLRLTYIFNELLPLRDGSSVPLIDRLPLLQL